MIRLVLRVIITVYKLRLFFMPSVILNGSTGRVNQAKIDLKKTIKLLESELVLVRVDKRSKGGS